VTTRKRYLALQWAHDHEHDPTAALFIDRPTKRMFRRMAREGQMIRMPTGSFGNERWFLTTLGRELLATRPKRRDHDAGNPEQKDRAPGDAGADAKPAHQR
jgi:hypothetical protein